MSNASFVRRAPGLVGALIAGAIAAIGAAAPAGATTYNETIAFDPTSLTCGDFDGDKLCTQVVQFGSVNPANPGDIYNVTVTMSSALTVPGSRYQDLVLVNLLQPGATFGPGAIGPYVAKSHITMSGYAGPPNPISGGGTTAWDQGYLALAGFGGGYGVPNAGFSLTGLTAQIKLVTPDSNGLQAVAFTISQGIPEPATWAMMILGLGAAGGILRRRARLACCEDA
jgi:hypothetical protein